VSEITTRGRPGPVSRVWRPAGRRAATSRPTGRGHRRRGDHAEPPSWAEGGRACRSATASWVDAGSSGPSDPEHLRGPGGRSPAPCTRCSGRHIRVEHWAQRAETSRRRPAPRPCSARTVSLRQGPVPSTPTSTNLGMEYSGYVEPGGYEPGRVSAGDVDRARVRRLSGLGGGRVAGRHETSTIWDVQRRDPGSW